MTKAASYASAAANSMAIDPCGRVIAREPNRSGFATATLDLDDATGLRRVILVAKHRRPETFA